jgi:hypothetical protein
MPRTSYAQQPPRSVTLPSTTVATDGEFIAWTVPAAHNGGVSAVYAAPLRDNPSATATLIATESEPEITTLLLSDGIVVWATPASAGRLTLRAQHVREGESITVATDALRPVMVGAILFWWDIQPQAAPGGTATLMRRDLSTLDAAQALHQIPFDLAYPGPIRASERWVAWTAFQGLAYASAIWSLYVLPLGAAEARLVQENIGCADSSGYNLFALSGDTLVYSTASCYRGPQNDGKLTILDLTTNERHISGPHNNITLFPAGRYLFWNTYRQQNTSQVDLWGFDPQTISAFRLSDDLTPIAFDGGMLFWTKREDNATSVAFAPLPQLLPSASRSLDDPSVVGRRFFPETSHTLAGSFHDYWVRNGGLPVFGFPVTEEFIQQSPDATQGYPVQYFERQRFEYHSEHRGTPYEVLLGRLGAEALARSGRVWQDFPKAAPTTPHYFGQTGQAIAPEFWDYWRTHGLEFGDPGVSEREALALWGLPISPPLQERLETDETLLVQWFERARFEYHPSNPDPYKVLLGRLAVETVDGFGWR